MNCQMKILTVISYLFQQYRAVLLLLSYNAFSWAEVREQEITLLSDQKLKLRRRVSDTV